MQKIEALLAGKKVYNLNRPSSIDMATQYEVSLLTTFKMEDTIGRIPITSNTQC